MNIVFSVNSRFLPFLFVTIKSFRKWNDSNYTFHVLHSDLTIGEQKVVTDWCGEIDIIFHSLKLFDFNDLPEMGHLKRETYYRLIIPRILYDVDKAIYLDCDILIRGSLDGLRNLDMGCYPIAAARNPGFIPPAGLMADAGRSYFNAGVLVLNLDFWRKNNISNRCMIFARENPSLLTYADQCALNSIIDGNYIVLEDTWNCQAGLENTVINPVIVHFTGSIKPTDFRSKSVYRREFLETLRDSEYYRKIRSINTMKKIAYFSGVYLVWEVISRIKYSFK